MHSPLSSSNIHRESASSPGEISGVLVEHACSSNVLSGSNRKHCPTWSPQQRLSSVFQGAIRMPALIQEECSTSSPTDPLSMSKTKVLVVEDYRPLAETMEYQLQRAGYEVYRASDGRDALNQAKLLLPDVVFLDVDLPVLSGIDVCKELRADPTTKDTLVMMISALGEESDQVVGFAVGADDYVIKPVESYKVLLQRLKALLRRREPALEDNESVSHRGITVDRRRFTVTIGDHLVKLTKSEFRLLDTLIRQPGRAFDRSELVEAALGEGTMVLERTIDVHIRALRRKLGDEANLIETVRGVGYRFNE
jgi:two-component system phosphate regulon response regulator PhoB